MNSGKVFLGLLAGIAVGATLGILFAPDKGSKTRSKISQKKDDYADTLEEKFNEFTESITEKFDSVRNEANKAVKNGKHKVDMAEAEVIDAFK
jgi:gas vesicle protein